MPIWYGGDYNPEQWPEDVWPEDVTLMQRAGVTLATVGVFSWARLEPRDGEFDFDWLDRVIDGLHEGGVRVDLATATASPPPWLTAANPDVLPVTADGVRLSPGSRQAYCPSSPVYRRYAARLVSALAERYGSHPALELWHINNEYGCHVSHCFCDESANAFRVWLEARYGSVGALNAAWGTAFWSQRYSEFAEVLPPRAAPTFINPTQLLDFDRFSSDQLLECFLMEKRILRDATPEVPVTTNFMGFFKGADYWRWAQEVDVVADDLYPDPADPDATWSAAAARDLMRSLGGGKPWMLMEQAPSAVNWRTRNAPKPPGMMRALSYQAVARGADAVLFFQWRQSAAGAEKFHSGMVPHSGTDTRVWREIEQLGGELGRLDDVVGTSTPAQAAIVLDWDSWWAIEQDASPTSTSYLETIAPWHRALTARGIVVDFAQADASLARYPLIIVPSLFVASDAQLQAIADAARAGSTVLVTCQTGILDENLRVRTGGYLGPLREALGLWIEEFAPLAGSEWTAPPTIAVEGRHVADAATAVFHEEGRTGRADGYDWSEIVRVEGAEVLARFVDGVEGSAGDGGPALTRAVTGEGAAWYLATRLGNGSLDTLVAALATEAGVAGASVGGVRTGWLETVRRGDLTFAINHSATDSALIETGGTDILTGQSAAQLRLPPQGVAILRQASGA